MNNRKLKCKYNCGNMFEMFNPGGIMEYKTHLVNVHKESFIYGALSIKKRSPA